MIKVEDTTDHVVNPSTTWKLLVLTSMSLAEKDADSRKPMDDHSRPQDDCVRVVIVS